MPRTRLPADVRTHLLAGSSEDLAVNTAVTRQIPDGADTDGRRLWLGFVENVNLPILAKIVPGPHTSNRRGGHRRALWVIVLVACTAFSLYQIASQVLLYLRYPVNVVFDTIEVDGVGTTLEFPAVTICNNNYFRKSALRQGAGAALRDLFDQGASADQRSAALFSNYTDADWLRLYEQVQHNAEEMIVKCLWMAKPCSAKDFAVTYTDMGRCYTFNSPASTQEIRQMTGSGSSYGLKLVLNAQTEDYTFSLSDAGLGFKIYVHNQSEVLPPMSGFGTSVGTGVITNVEISLQKIGMLPAPHGSCTVASRLPLPKYRNYWNGTTARYTERSCKWGCITDCVVRHCGCKEFYYPQEAVSICNPHRTRTCAHPQLTACAAGTGRCSTLECPPTCERFKYSTVIHTMPIAGTFYEKLRQEQPTNGDTLLGARVSSDYGSPEYWKRNVVQLNVYFSDLAYESLEHTPAYPAMQLFCDIGGALGLLLGATVLTLLEIADYLIVHYAQKLL